MLEEADLSGLQVVAADEAFLREGSQQIHAQAQASGVAGDPWGPSEAGLGLAQLTFSPVCLYVVCMCAVGGNACA